MLYVLEDSHRTSYLQVDRRFIPAAAARPLMPKSVTHEITQTYIRGQKWRSRSSRITKSQNHFCWKPGQDVLITPLTRALTGVSVLIHQASEINEEVPSSLAEPVPNINNLISVLIP